MDSSLHDDQVLVVLEDWEWSFKRDRWREDDGVERIYVSNLSLYKSMHDRCR